MTITPASAREQAAVTVQALSTGSPAPGQVRARFISAPAPAARRTVKATGVDHQAARQAGGDVTFYNEATYPQTVAEATLITGADGVQVATDEPAAIPAGNPPSFGVVTVRAHDVLAGSHGNIAAFDINRLCCAVNPRTLWEKFV